MDERSRHRLYLKLEEILGPDEAGILMDHLPPAGLANLATKDDLRALRGELIGRMDGLEAQMVGRLDGLEARMVGRMDGMERRMESQEHRLTAKIEQSARRLVMWMSTMVLMTGGLAFAAGRFV